MLTPLVAGSLSSVPTATLYSLDRHIPLTEGRISARAVCRVGRLHKDAMRNAQEVRTPWSLGDNGAVLTFRFL